MCSTDSVRVRQQDRKGLQYVAAALHSSLLHESWSTLGEVHRNATQMRTASTRWCDDLSLLEIYPKL